MFITTLWKQINKSLKKHFPKPDEFETKFILKIKHIKVRCKKCQGYFWVRDRPDNRGVARNGDSLCSGCDNTQEG